MLEREPPRGREPDDRLVSPEGAGLSHHAVDDRVLAVIDVRDDGDIDSQRSWGWPEDLSARTARRWRGLMSAISRRWQLAACLMG